MTKAKYMALEDFQTLWTNQIKPKIPEIAAGGSLIEVSDMTALTSQQIETLQTGSRVTKSDASGKHAYTVTFRSATGICLTYADAENVETVSYDKAGGTWTYNSTDVTPIASHASDAECEAAAGEIVFTVAPS